MKRVLMVALSCVVSCSGVAEAAARKPRVSVAAFDNKASGGSCYHGGGWLGTGFQEQLLTALARSSKIQIYERQHIDQVYNQEHNLRNRSRRGGPQKNKFEAADFTIAGAITEFEACAEGGNTGVSVGGLLNKTVFKNNRSVGMGNLNVGVGSEKAKVVLDMRLINVETGEMLTSLSAEGAASRKRVNLDTHIYGTGFSHSGFKNTPLGEASRAAIEDAARQILAAIPDTVEDSNEEVVAEPPRSRRAAAEDEDGGGAAASRGDAELPSDSGEEPSRGHQDLDQDVLEYKAVYCPDAFAGDSNQECHAVELLKKLPETKRMEILDLNKGTRLKVGYNQLDRLVKLDPRTLKVGDFVLLSELYNDNYGTGHWTVSNIKPEEKADLARCAVTRIVRSERFVQTSCHRFKEVKFISNLGPARKPTLFLSTPKLKARSGGEDIAGDSN